MNKINPLRPSSSRKRWTVITALFNKRVKNKSEPKKLTILFITSDVVLMKKWNLMIREYFSEFNIHWAPTMIQGLKELHENEDIEYLIFDTFSIGLYGRDIYNTILLINNISLCDFLILCTERQKFELEEFLQDLAIVQERKKFSVKDLKKLKNLAWCV